MTNYNLQIGPHTRLVPVGGNPRNFWLIEIGRCESCGGVVEEPNAVQLTFGSLREKKPFHSVPRLAKRPPEIHPAEDGGPSYCTDCAP